MKASQFLQKLSAIKTTELENIKGLGPILINNFKDFLASDRYQKLVEKFEVLEEKNKGLDIIIESPSKANLELSGQKICITGSFEISRDQIKELLEAKGAEVTNTVSKNTTILLAGEDAGSKLAKAQELGIPIEHDLKILGS